MALSKRRHERALSDPPSKGGVGCLIAFGAIFAAFGSFFVVMLFALPLWRVAMALSWHEVPCTIVASSVEEKSDSDGSTYRVAVRFRYEVTGNGNATESYESTRYDFTNGTSSSGRAGKQAIVDTLSPGTQTACWVNSAQPTEVVLVRGITGEMWMGSINIIFPLVGMGIIFFALRQGRKDRLRRAGLSGLSDDSVTVPTALTEVDASGPSELTPVQTVQKKFLGLAIFALFWNGFVWSILGFKLIPDWQRGHPEWFPLIFLGVFALIGLFIVGAAIYQALAMTNPRIRVAVNRRTCRPGDSWEVSWECLGNARQLQSLALTLEGVEEATYRRGTSTTTDHKVFCRIPLFTTDDHRSIAHGRATVIIPEDAVPTFTAPNNKLHWRLTIRGAIPRWPDLSDDYAVLILPSEIKR